MADDLDVSQLRQALEAAGAGWRAEQNPVLALSPEDRVKRLGYVPGPEEMSLRDRERVAQEQLQATAQSAVGVPAAIDWRNVGGRDFAGPVRDQGGCGSCVAFGTTATVESAARITFDLAANDPSGGVLPDLSEAQLFFCGAGMNCAIGWSVGPAMQYCQDHGLAPASCFPYTPQDQACNLCPNWQQEVVQLSGYHWINAADAMKQWIATRGPVTACFSVYADFFAYAGGVYRHVQGDYQGGHCVVVVGYDDAQQAWLCKNSWGTGWGEGGFFWIAYGQCGIDASMTAVDGFTSVYPLYDDLYVRDNLGDVGQAPQTGTPSASPDIVPAGIEPIDPDQLVGNWHQDVGHDITLDQANYIYVRARNFASGAVAGQASLYFSPASLLLWPSQWAKNILSTDSGATQVSLDAASQGQVVVGQAPFVWTPSAPGDGDHYCLVARVVTAAHPDPLPGDMPSVDAFATFIQSNPGFGWRNVATVPGDAPSASAQVALSVPNAVELYVAIDSETLPVGAQVAFTCGTPGPSPLLVLDQVEVSSPGEVLGILSAIPAGFASSLTFSVWKSGTTIPAGGASTTLKAFYVVADDHPLAESATTVDDPLIGPVQGVLVGSFSLRLLPDQ